MHIYLNGEHVNTAAQILAQVLTDLGFDGKRVVVAVNETFVPKTDWSSHEIADEDRLEVLAAIEGG